MTAKVLSEYDAFGPWIYPVEDVHSLPRLFRPYREKLEGNLMAFKIPRDIERRNATADMDLYDAVVGVFPDRILYLERNTGGSGCSVTERAVSMEKIDSLERWTCLLDGVLTIHTDEGPPIAIPYNTVSDNVIRQAVQLIRKFMPEGEVLLPAVRDAPRMEPRLDFMEFGFMSLCRKLTGENPDLALVAYQPFLKYAVPRRFKSPLLTKLGLKESVKSAFAVLMGRRETVIIHQSHYGRARSLKGYTYSETILPLSRLEKLGAVETARGPASFFARTRDNAVELRCDPENQDIRSLAIFSSSS